MMLVEVATMPVSSECARCGGNLFTSQDVYGDYVVCLQCGDVQKDNDVETFDGFLSSLTRNLGPRLRKAGPRLRAARKASYSL